MSFFSNCVQCINFQTVYPDDPKRPLSVSEMIEINMLDADVVEGHKRFDFLCSSSAVD